ncbi:P-type conjugative transfer protein TrbJ [uncultured Parasphingorhabdus sp.]|uniref:P-type conjugative transfer protein TrbJ n=1 Tax=uncultured Parasphingorhabdus sp. TaxID=2709694 RepID=UPI0030DCB609|tara:strand:- start:13407 stop:14138 length:732 start_codon:yes stop_codon:yes gene_type:complete
MKKHVLPALLASVMSTTMIASITLPATPAFAIPVFDANNYAQNLVQAARALQQINQQIQQLQNEAAMIAQGAKNLEKIDFPQLRELTETMQKIDRLMGQAQGIGFKVDDLDTKFRKTFPGSSGPVLTSNQSLRDAKARIEGAMEAFRQTMAVQSQVVENVTADAEALAAIVARSQGAGGSLQAQQATNQLLALTAKQQFQLQNMMAAQFRAETVEAARRTQAESDARAATRKFLGKRNAYTPE